MPLLCVPLSFARLVNMCMQELLCLAVLAHISRFPHNASFLRTASIIANILLFMKKELQSTLTEGEE